MKKNHKISWKELDENWKDKLHQQSEMPDIHLWTNLEDKLNNNPAKKEEKKKSFFLNNWHWAAILAITTGLFWAKIANPIESSLDTKNQLIGKEERREKGGERREKREERRDKREMGRMFEERREKVEVGRIFEERREKGKVGRIFEERREKGKVGRIFEERREKGEVGRIFEERREKGEFARVFEKQKEKKYLKREQRRVFDEGREKSIWLANNHEKEEKKETWDHSEDQQPGGNINHQIDLLNKKTVQNLIAENKKVIQEDEIWVKINIDPILNDSPLPEKGTLLTDKKEVIKKKKTFSQLFNRVKNILNGENPKENELINLDEGIHQVANTYYKTEEKIKQTFQ